MGRIIIDLSISIETGLPSDPEMMIPKPHGFMAACFPIKIKGASAGWTRR